MRENPEQRERVRMINWLSDCISKEKISKSPEWLGGLEKWMNSKERWSDENQRKLSPLRFSPSSKDHFFDWVVWLTHALLMYLFPWRMFSWQRRRLHPKPAGQPSRYARLYPIIRRLTLRSTPVEPVTDPEINESEDGSAQVDNASSLRLGLVASSEQEKAKCFDGVLIVLPSRQSS